MSKATTEQIPIMIGIGMEKKRAFPRFTLIYNGNFAIRPRDSDDGNDPEQQTYSPYLYIKNGFVLDESSPLKKLMDMGLIVEYTEGVPTKKGFTVYGFFRELEDSVTYDENYEERDESLQPTEPDKPDPIIKNENDCLKFGEAMGIAMRTGDMNYVINHLQTDITDPEVCLREDPRILFGEGIKKNQKLYRKAGLIDNHAIPEPGQSYAIVRQESVKNKDNKISADYHIAFVIYKENGINITLEAEANAGRKYLPNFAFYDTNPDGYTFHKRWAGDLPGDTERKEVLYSNGNTIVLQPTRLTRIVAAVRHSIGTKRKRGGKNAKKRGKTMKSR